MLRVLAGTILASSARAQEVSIPDPALNTVIRETLAKPSGPLTVQDMLSLTNLDASFRGVQSLEGLGTAHNLTRLILDGDPLTSFVFPPGLTNLASLHLAANHVTSITLPADMTRLTSFALTYNLNLLHDFSFLSDQTNLTGLDLGYNELGSLTHRSEAEELRFTPIRQP
jgi:Leucine-rich repeat (LRR) protein